MFPNVTKAKKEIDAVGADEFSRSAGEWLMLGAQPRSTPMREDQTVYAHEAQYDLYTDKNEAVLKGLAWACAASQNGALAGPLGGLAESARRLPISLWPARSTPAGT